MIDCKVLTIDLRLTVSNFIHDAQFLFMMHNMCAPFFETQCSSCQTVNETSEMDRRKKILHRQQGPLHMS